MKRVRYFARKFLNKPTHHSVAFVYAKIGPGVEFKIGDCDRSISLSFDSYGKKAEENALYKARTLATVMQEFADKLEEYYASDRSHIDDY